MFKRAATARKRNDERLPNDIILSFFLRRITGRTAFKLSTDRLREGAHNDSEIFLRVVAFQ